MEETVLNDERLYIFVSAAAMSGRPLLYESQSLERFFSGGWATAERGTLSNSWISRCLRFVHEPCLTPKPQSLALLCPSIRRSAYSKHHLGPLACAPNGAAETAMASSLPEHAPSCFGLILLRIRRSFTEDQFIAKAIEAGHSRVLSALLPAVLEKAVAMNASTSLQDLASMRLSWLKRWSSRAQELAQLEKDLRRSLPPHRAAVLAGKRILLYEELLQRYGCPDLGVVSLMKDDGV